MMQAWGGWKRFPDVKGGDAIEAPAGPGVYEVRHTLSGRLMAFGHARNVANAISELSLNGGVSPFARFFGRQPLVSRVSDLAAAAGRADDSSGCPIRRQPHRLWDATAGPDRNGR